MNVLINLIKVSGFRDQLPRTPLWRSSRRRESLHSPAPIGPGTPKRGCSYRRVFLMYRTRGYDPLVHKKNPGRRMRGGTKTDQGLYRSWWHHPRSRATHNRANGRAGARYPWKLRPYERSRCANTRKLLLRLVSWCARLTGDSYGRTTDAPSQRFNGVNLRAALEVG